MQCWFFQNIPPCLYIFFIDEQAAPGVTSAGRLARLPPSADLSSRVQLKSDVSIVWTGRAIQDWHLLKYQSNR